jgi:DNA-directed RNA polymerase subunit beta'
MKRRVDLHASLMLKDSRCGKADNLLIKTDRNTVGRVLFNQVVPEKYGFINQLLTKKSLRDIIGDIVKMLGTAKAAKFLDDIKNLGFKMAYKGGLSFNLET